MTDREVIEMVSSNLRKLGRTIGSDYASLFIETQIEALAKVGEDIVDGLSKVERGFVHAGQYINAIKEHRGRTGAGLKESKDIVDAYRVRHGLMAA